MWIYPTDRLIVLDDGEYYVELAASGEPGPLVHGFLKRRCYCSVTSPEGYECIGGFERDAHGHWLALIDAANDPYTGNVTRPLGRYPDRPAAVAALWNARRRAHCRHKDDDCEPAPRLAPRAPVGCRVIAFRRRRQPSLEVTQPLG